jgi:uncharacterized iron-regulated protein
MKLLRIGFAVALALVAFGCAAPMTLAPVHGFVQPLGKTHPLAGRIYQAAAHDFVSVSELNDAIAASEYLVLGETHDNRDHHLLEAKLVEQFASAHPTAAAGFEMLDEDVRAAVQCPPRDPDAFARAVQWDKSGWPEFAQYKPVFKVVLSRSMPVIAAHPSGEKVRASMAAIPSDEIHALHLDVPLPEAARDVLRAEIRESHCGHAPAAMLDMMERAPCYKDAFMARSIRDAKRPVVLVTGAGHARNDRAVPHFLRLRGATRVTSVAFLEVDDARTTPDRYDVAAFDFVVFTPRVSDEDPCERFEEELKKMQQQEAPTSSPEGIIEKDLGGFSPESERARRTERAVLTYGAATGRGRKPLSGEKPKQIA